MKASDQSVALIVVKCGDSISITLVSMRSSPPQTSQSAPHALGQMSLMAAMWLRSIQTISFFQVERSTGS